MSLTSFTTYRRRMLSSGNDLLISVRIGAHCVIAPRTNTLRRKDGGDSRLARQGGNPDYSVFLHTSTVPSMWPSFGLTRDIIPMCAGSLLNRTA